MLEWPPWDEVASILMLRDYNTRIVVIGAALLGLGGGVIGTFMLLRKRALMSDVISHATLPGIGFAFLIMTAAGGTGKSLVGLLIGALISGTIGMGAVLLIRAQTRLKEDAVLGVVLSVFFGLGVVIMRIIQNTDTGHAAGLESFIYGKTASMLASDVYWIAIAATIITAICALLYKEFELLCFDQDFAGSLGWRVHLMDAMMMGLVVAMTVIGLQAVGLILIIALLIIPPAAARFWTHHLLQMLVISAFIGAASCLLGSLASALPPRLNGESMRLPAGATIVVFAAAIFLVSMIFGTEHGMLRRWIERFSLSRKISQQHLLRMLYEAHHGETAQRVTDLPPLSVCLSHDFLLENSTWSSGHLHRILAALRRKGEITETGGNMFCLTESGIQTAARVVRNHRLWEVYLVRYADIAPFHVDYSADQIEHVLGDELVAGLDRFREDDHPELVIPASPHALPYGDASSTSSVSTSS
jgi:manganese/zinc/iron transport system permease protein